MGQADLLGDLVVAAALKGEQDEGGAWSEPGRSRDGVPQGLKDLLLRFGDRDLGSLTRHEERCLVSGKLAKPGNFNVTVNFLGSQLRIVGLVRFAPAGGRAAGDRLRDLGVVAERGAVRAVAGGGLTDPVAGVPADVPVGDRDVTSGDPAWRAWKAMHYHYETQPLPTWTNWHLHQGPV